MAHNANIFSHNGVFLLLIEIEYVAKLWPTKWISCSHNGNILVFLLLINIEYVTKLWHPKVTSYS